MLLRFFLLTECTSWIRGNHTAGHTPVIISKAVLFQEYCQQTKVNLSLLNQIAFQLLQSTERLRANL